MGFDDGWIGQREYDTYKQIFHMMTRFLAYPDMMIYLRVEPEVAYERIKMRGRGAEEGLPLEYLKSLFVGYEGFIAEIKQFVPVLTIDWSEFRSTDEVVTLLNEQKRNTFSRSMLRI